MVFFKCNLIFISLIVFNISHYAFTVDEMACLIEMDAVGFDNSDVGSCNANIDIGPKELELQVGGFNIELNFHKKRYGYGNQPNFVIDYKILVFFYKKYFIDDPVINEANEACPNPTLFCSYYDYYENNNFQIYHMNITEECFNNLSQNNYNNDVVSGLENLNLGYPFNEIFPYGFFHLGAYFMINNYGINLVTSEYKILYKIYITLYFLNLHDRIQTTTDTTGASSSSISNQNITIMNTDMPLCATPGQFCLNLLHYRKTKLLSTDLKRYQVCLDNLKLLFENIEMSGLDILEANLVDFQLYLTSRNLSFDRNFHMLNYGYILTDEQQLFVQFISMNYGYILTADFLISYLIYLHYYDIHIKPLQNVFGQQLASPAEFCFSFNIFKFHGFRTTEPFMFNACVDNLCNTHKRRFLCDANNHDILYDKAGGPDMRVLLGRGFSLENTDQTYFGIIGNMSYILEYKILLVYFREVVINLINNLLQKVDIPIEVKFPSPIQFCFDYNHYKKIEFRLPAY